ncbi:DNA translocase FtsK [Candidatus Methylacidiphilum fumarolicum]|uniref:FtsK domain-containing protein n=2 Tax=Candidatus Methylacidiphilum fumarolicum TaxID=591154 RepID=I0JXJ9_METFB|nr:FtsK/SpoIIIE domain-containing protein [Candidatus Methylacidiphilum fumarolicum]TFE69240.1 hypothetical protein A7K73_06170 [Candidatus Methylacidiphilum fumarolicum]TFE72236.1 DNA translocase FtsK [Candidatus Methylacidiphilum fumarolicum]TFE72377.1 DNA translocase FtsK [Candidatus Methylacidiphilum fumarolicum]TFE76966.1 hypothetical protein A7D33_07085 [Candidatus Methylacidiphilum fumarolicum]CAI9086289.1 FtsK domain-containing protein [Candidatus Methylacidiphilum fumarolicum]
MPPPFEVQIVTDPRVLPDSPLRGLNERPLKFLLKKFGELCQKNDLPKAYLISSPEAGYGKTYLIGRLFQELKGKATLIYFYAFIDSSRFWINIFDRILTELTQPEEFIDIDRRNNRSYTQFEIYTSRIIGNLLADLITSKLIEPQELIHQGLVRGVVNELDVVEALRKAPNQKADFSNPSEKWIQWMQASYWDSLAQCCENALYRRGINIGELRDLIPLFWIFFWYSANPDLRHRETCIEWLRGATLEEEDVRNIGLPINYNEPMDLPIDTRNDLCRKRVYQFCNLASFARPFVFCFDQTERYGEDKSLCQKFGSVIGSLVNECKNHLIILTTNFHAWEQNRNYIQKADLERIAYEKQLELEGLNIEQARELIEQRIKRYPIEESKVRKLLEKLPSFFSTQSKVGIRKFLQWAEREFEQIEETNELREGDEELEKIFNEEKKKTLSGQVLFQPDLFLEAIQVALIGKKESIQQIKHDYYSLCWEHDGDQTTVYFGCEKSDNWKRWGAIAKKTLELSASFQAKSRRFLGIFPRSHELKTIPGKNWKETKEKETIDQAKNSGLLRIEALDKEKTADFYALAILYRNAISRDINYSKEKIEEFASKKLASWIDPLISLLPQLPPLPITSTAPTGSEITVTQPDSSNENDPYRIYREKLNEFFSKNNIDANVRDYKIAPQFVRFLVEKDVRVRITNIVARKKDIQLHLGLDVPPFIDAYRNYVKIDVAIPQIDCVVPWKKALRHLKGNLSFPIGKTIDLEQSEWVIGDFMDSNFAHLLVAGTTGSGKSQFLKSLIGAILYKFPKKARVFLIDFKGTDFFPLESIKSHKEAEDFLKKAVEEMNSRNERLNKEMLNDLNSLYKTGKGDIPYWIIVIDEYADMISGLRGNRRREFESYIQRIAQKGRSAGIHLIISTQSPRKEIVSGLIKQCLPGKISFRVTDDTESLLILDRGGAEQLRGKGDLLCNFQHGRFLRAQSAFITDKEWKKVVLQAVR